MLQSQIFTKTLREAPKDEKSINAQLLIRGGFVDKLMAGVYSYLPLGFLVLKKIESIIREEMNSVGGQEVSLPALHPKEIWIKTDRWKYPEMFKIKNRAGKEFGLGWTHEEVITPLVKKFVDSYKDLPVSVYQFQTKFRDELRAKSGLLRGVEFYMKDLYSFHSDEKDLDRYYDRMIKAYFNVFNRCGLGRETFLTYASGGSFSKYSHEFQAVTEYGEDEIYLCPKCRVAVNKEIIKEEKNQCPQCKGKELEARKAIEVGNIFKLKNKFSKQFDFTFKNEKGREEDVMMGCYGIGPSRVMGAIVEAYNDKNGIVWPESVAPFKVHLIQVGEGRAVKKEAKKIYEEMKKRGVEVLFDDRDKSPGEKFKDSDLIGIPARVVVSEKTLEKKSVEVKKRNEDRVSFVSVSKIKTIC